MNSTASCAAGTCSTARSAGGHRGVVVLDGPHARRRDVVIAPRRIDVDDAVGALGRCARRRGWWCGRALGFAQQRRLAEVVELFALQVRREHLLGDVGELARTTRCLTVIGSSVTRCHVALGVLVRSGAALLRRPEQLAVRLLRPCAPRRGLGVGRPAGAAQICAAHNLPEPPTARAVVGPVHVGDLARRVEDGTLLAVPGIGAKRAEEIRAAVNRSPTSVL